MEEKLILNGDVLTDDNELGKVVGFDLVSGIRYVDVYVKGRGVVSYRREEVRKVIGLSVRHA